MKDQSTLNYEDVRFLRQLVGEQDVRGPLGLTRKLAELERRLKPIDPSVVYELTPIDTKTVDVVVNLGVEHVPYQRLKERAAEFLKQDVENVRTRWLTGREIERQKYPETAVLRVTVFNKELKKLATKLKETKVSKAELDELAKELDL